MLSIFLIIFFSPQVKEIKLQDEASSEIENDEKTDSKSNDILDLKCLNITDEEKEILLSKNEGIIYSF